MKHSQAKHGGCCSKTMKMVGDFWTLMIVSALAEKELRFCELQRAVEGINPVTLTNRLKKLEEEQFVQREEESLDKQSVTYKLTHKGEGLLPVIASIHTFAQKYAK